MDMNLRWNNLWLTIEYLKTVPGGVVCYCKIYFGSAKFWRNWAYKYEKLELEIERFVLEEEIHQLRFEIIDEKNICFERR